MSSHPLSLAALRAWDAAYGPIPDDYLAVDVETSGLLEDDLPLQVGWCEVVGRAAAHNAALAIDWAATLDPAALAILAARMETTRAVMTRKGKAYRWTPDLLGSLGRPVAEVGARVGALFAPTRTYVAHYGWGFDYAVIGRFMAAHSPAGFCPDHGNLLDTQLLVKVGLCDLHPHPGEPVREFVRRVAAVRFRGGSTLEDCTAMFQLDRVGVKRADLHAACYDAWTTHLVLERLRDLIAPTTGGNP